MTTGLKKIVPIGVWPEYMDAIGKGKEMFKCLALEHHKRRNTTLVTGYSIALRRWDEIAECASYQEAFELAFKIRGNCSLGECIIYGGNGWSLPGTYQPSNGGDCQ